MAESKPLVLLIAVLAFLEVVTLAGVSFVSFKVQKPTVETKVVTIEVTPAPTATPSATPIAKKVK